jgi:Fe-S cluster biogenesis protein NfuA
MNKNFSSIFIKTSETPNPQFVKFMPGKEVMEDNETFDIANKKEALCSPLAVQLFDIKGITRVFYGPDYISIGKEELIDWSDLKPLIIDEIVRHYTANDDLFLVKPVSDDTEIKEGDSEAIQLIKEIIAARIRPVVQEDGGDIKYISFDEIDGVVYLQMMGSCKGCPSSGVTLKNGIEKMMIHYVAEVQSVEEYDEDEIDEF